MAVEVPEHMVLHRSTATRRAVVPLVRTDSVTSAATVIAIVLIALALASAVAGVLPEQPLVWVITPLRLVLGLAVVSLMTWGRPVRTFASLLDLPWLVLVIASGIATYAADPGLAAWRWLLTMVVAYYVTVGLRQRYPGAGAALAMTALILLACASLVALHQAATGISSGFCRNGFADVACTARGAQIRVNGTFTNPNLLAAFVVLVLPLAIVAAASIESVPMRWVAFTAPLAAVTALLLTYSRAGYIGLLVALVVAAFTLGANRRLVGRGLRIGGTVLLAVVIVASLAVGVGVRGEVWYAAVATAYHHPFGVGLGKAGAYISFRIPGTVVYAHAHNLWLNWLVEAGVVGFLAVCAITILVILRMRVALRTGDPITVAVASGLAGFGVLCLADHPANSTAVALPLAVMLGLAVTCVRPGVGRRVAR